MPRKIDATTKRWIKNESDRIAASAGCVMNLSRGKFVCDWIEEYCHLYEGVKPTADGTLPKFVLMKWQREFLMRVFGWQQYSKDHKKFIRRFRKVGLWVPKKNGKSPLLAAVGLYMLMAEGIHGQKCFSVARDKEQAMIQQRHAIAMIGASPYFSDKSSQSFCEINKTTGRISNLFWQSFYAVISGENIEGQQGLNAGFIGVDETAVVDGRTMAVLEYAGAHSVEPIQMEVSTAGNNPDGYGRRQFNYGRQVVIGAQKDIQFLHVEYSVDEGITESDFQNDFKNQISKCNPSMGTTVYFGELKTSFERAQGSLSLLNDYMMYRANRWQASMSPWLNIAFWQQCVASELYKPRFLVRRPKRDAYAALDLSKVNDMAAFSLSIPLEGGRILTITLLWIPERYARLNNHLAPFLKWAEDGYIELTPGDTMDYTIVRRGIKKLCKHFNVLQCAYDPMYAEQTMQDLTEGVWNSETGELIEDGIGWERVEFPQNMPTYAKPTADFEGLVLDKLLIHGDNPCLNWQAGHVEVYKDTFGNKRPIKPKSAKGDEQHYKKIDGIVTLCMSTALALKAEKNPYENQGLTFA